MELAQNPMNDSETKSSIFARLLFVLAKREPRVTPIASASPCPLSRSRMVAHPGSYRRRTVGNTLVVRSNDATCSAMGGDAAVFNVAQSVFLRVMFLL